MDRRGERQQRNAKDVHQHIQRERDECEGRHRRLLVGRQHETPDGRHNEAGRPKRRHLADDEKRRIGEHAATLISNGSSLFINIGTTTEEVARALRAHEGLLVITNNIHVAGILLPSQRIDVIVAGGMLRRADGGIVGEQAVDFMSQFKVDYAVIGVSAIDDDGSLLDFDYREVRVAQAIIANARNVILVADSMKFTRTAPVRIGHLSEINIFVTDRAPPETIGEICRHSGTMIAVAPGGPPPEESEAG